MLSILVTAILDVLFVAACIVAMTVLLRHVDAIRFAGAGLAIVLIGAGLAVWGGYHLIDLFALISLAIIPGAQAEAGWRDMLQHEGRHTVEAVTAGFLVSGFVLLLHRTGILLRWLRRSHYELEHELDSRTAAEVDLKAEAVNERAARRAKSAFLRSLSHELRTPLNGVLGLSSLLSNTELDSNQRKLLAALEQSTQAVMARVNDVLDLSSLESEQVELRSQTFNPCELAAAVTGLFEPLTAEKKLAMQVDCAEEADRPMIGDPTRIRQLLSHLVSNAIKFTPAGEIRLAVRLCKMDTEHAVLEFEVADTGVGMSAEALECLSSPDRLGASEAAGLGLAIAWRLVALMGGGLHFESTPGSGTTVTAQVRVQIEPEGG